MVVEAKIVIHDPANNFFILPESYSFRIYESSRVSTKEKSYPRNDFPRVGEIKDNRYNTPPRSKT